MNELERKEIQEAVGAADVLVQSKISEAKRQCDDAIRQVSAIRRELLGRL